MGIDLESVESKYVMVVKFYFFFSKCNIHFWNDVVFLSNGLVNYQQSSRELWFTLVEIEQASPRN